MSPVRPSIRQNRNPIDTSASTNRTVQYQDSRVDVKLVLSALWIAMLFVFAYVDIFAFFREDVLRAGLGGKISGTALSVGQGFLTPPCSTSCYRA